MRSRTPWRLRAKPRPLSLLGMTIMWAVLWGSLSPVVLISGALLGWLIDIAFPLPPIFWRGRFHLAGFVVLTAHLLWDLVVSSLRLLRLIFARQVTLNAGIVRVDLHTDDDLYQVQVAELISLVPGTVVIEVVRHPRRLYLHVVDMVDDDAVEQVQRMALGVESRVLKAFGSAAELAAFDAACRARVTVEAAEMEVES